MIYYVLPGIGRYGGVKKAFQCIDMLTARGHAATVATPGGERPDWFATNARTMTHDALSATCRPADTVLFSWPPDADFVAALPAGRRVVHMQGANTPADEALLRRHREFQFISHGLHMTERLLAHGVVAPYVPNSISDVFRYDGAGKNEASIAFMPRKGGQLTDRLRTELGTGVAWLPIDGMHEREVARTLRGADMFLALSQHEAFGLPPLEAMHARCCVIGYPGDGGWEFMRHGESAHLVASGDQQGLLAALRHCLARPAYRERLRTGAADIAAYYSQDREQRYLIRALGL